MYLQLKQKQRHTSHKNSHTNKGTGIKFQTSDEPEYDGSAKYMKVSRSEEKGGKK
jgi:hypothetical protein